MHKLTEKQIQKILRHRKGELSRIRDKMLMLYDDLKGIHDSELMKGAALGSPRLTGMPSGKGEHRDLGDIYLKYRRAVYERDEELRKMMWYLSEEEDSICRVWLCFYALQDPYYTILKRLYVDGEKYQIVEAEFGGSHKTFEKHRSNAMTLMTKLYHSDMTDAQIIAQSAVNDPGMDKPSRNKKHTEEYDQICLNLEE